MSIEKLPTNVWSLTADDALHAFDSPSQGLSETEIQKRRTHFGANELPRTKRLSSFTILVQQFASPLVFILLGAAVVTIALHEWVDTSIILLAILLNAGLGFYQQFRAETALEKLNTYIKERARVVRDGTEQEIDSVLIVPGDIIRLKTGMRVPADARVLSENSLSVDEAILTGESLSVHKETRVLSEGTALPERTNTVFAGTLVVEGYGEAVVSATGNHTEIGHIARLVSETRGEATPLEKALKSLAWFIFIGVTVVVAAMFFFGLSRGIPVLEMLLIAIAVSVGAVPEALPIALTVILAIGLQRLAARKGIMRNLAAAETLGSATVIMTDKTGTLTEANMRATAIHTFHELISPDALQDSGTLGELSPEEKKLLTLSIHSVDVVIENPDSDAPEWRFAGRPIEVGLAKAARDAGFNIRETLAEQRHILLPFNSTNKFSISGHRYRKEYVALGAPDILLARSRMTKDEFVRIEERIRIIAERGERVIGVAQVPHTPSHFAQGTARAEDAHELVFLGIIVFRDPIRADAKQSLKKIEDLGVRVVMVTGDLKATAVAIARELGWTVNDGEVLSGEELHQLSDPELLVSLDRIKIFARVTPEDKLRVGKLLMEKGEVVAMTGDGVNDAPSLKAANIGIALGSGSDVAKGVADLVLLDDNFKTIVAAIEEGRRILENIRKTLAYLLSSALDGVILIGGSLILGLPLPLSALQIIWVNLVTEGFPALSFAFDQNHDHHKRGESHHVFNTEVRVLTIGVGVATSVLMFLLYWWMLHIDVPVAEAQSLIFACFSLYVLLIAYSFRSLRRPLFSFPTFENRTLNLSVFIGIAMIFLTFALPFMRDIFDLVLPHFTYWWIVALWLVGNVAIVELAKWWFRRLLIT